MDRIDRIKWNLKLFRVHFPKVEVFSEGTEGNSPFAGGE
jgi:hypothetical protein